VVPMRTIEIREKINRPLLNFMLLAYRDNYWQT
jgi:hypothetical protein